MMRVMKPSSNSTEVPPLQFNSWRPQKHFIASSIPCPAKLSGNAFPIQQYKADIGIAVQPNVQHIR